MANNGFKIIIFETKIPFMDTKMVIMNAKMIIMNANDRHNGFIIFQLWFHDGHHERKDACHGRRDGHHEHHDDNNEFKKGVMYALLQPATAPKRGL